MEEKRKNEIKNLAEGLAQDYFFEKYVDPYSTADDYEIEVRANNYVDKDGHSSYKGLITCDEGTFAIFLNTKLLENIYFSEARFTCAHELGHYFITEHHDYLKSGRSISFTGSDFKKTNDPFEEEANFFAANFLLPERQFREAILTSPTGLAGILSLKQYFHTSITCTAFRYTTLGITPSLLLLWGDDIRRKEIGPQLKSVVGQNPYAILNPNRVLQEKKICKHDSTKSQYVSGYTLLRNWLSVKSDLRNLVVYEETFYTSKFNLTLVTLVNPL